MSIASLAKPLIKEGLRYLGKNKEGLEVFKYAPKYIGGENITKYLFAKDGKLIDKQITREIRQDGRIRHLVKETGGRIQKSVTTSTGGSAWKGSWHDVYQDGKNFSFMRDENGFIKSADAEYRDQSRRRITTSVMGINEFNPSAVIDKLKHYFDIGVKYIRTN